MDCSRPALAAIYRASRAGRPREACGVLLGAEGVITGVERLANVARGEERFELDPGALVRIHREAAADGREILGVWHSHPRARPVLSEADRAGAWPGHVQLVVSLKSGGPRARLWAGIENGFRTLRLRVEGNVSVFLPAIPEFPKKRAVEAQFKHSPDAGHLPRPSTHLR